jgi:excisionase family DNA binding protein
MSTCNDISASDHNGSKGMEKLLTPDEVAKLLDVKMSWLMDHVTRIEPIIPHIRIGRMIRFRRQDVTQWLNSMVSTKPTWE